jgi:signal transduction histidine kinase
VDGRCGPRGGALAVVAIWSVTWSGEPLDPLGWASAAGSSVVLLFRRSRPVLVAAVILVIRAAYYPLSYVDGAIQPAFVVALYTAAAQSEVIAAVVLTAVALLAFAFTGFETGTPHLADAAAILLSGWSATAVAVGVVVHSRRAHSLATQQRRAEELRLRAVEERLRIARELHDALGHSLSVIHVQSSAALHRLSRHPDEAPDALTAVKESSKAALQELRSTLGMRERLSQ